MFILRFSKKASTVLATFFNQLPSSFQVPFEDIVDVPFFDIPNWVGTSNPVVVRSVIIAMLF
jgi:hypothetical protein